MDLIRAKEIVSAINARCFVTMGVGDGKLPSLEGVDLAEMVEAARIVRSSNGASEGDGTRTITVVPHDRLIAAAYVADHFEPELGAPYDPILMLPHRSLSGDSKALLLIAIDRNDDEDEGGPDADAP